MKIKNYTNYSQAEDLKRLHFVVESASTYLGSPVKVLEIGCGNGNMSYQLAMSGHHVLGIDLDGESIEKANAQFKAENLEYKRLAAEEITANRKFDVLLCSEVLEHLYEPLPVLKTIAGMMHKDSILILTVPNGKGPRETLVTRPIQKMQKKNSLTWKLVSKFKSSLGYKGITIQSSNHSLEHVQFFSLKQIRSMADECGLEVTKIRAANFVESVFPFSLITRIFRPMQKFDCFVADLLPVTWSSGFYLNLKKKT